VTALRPLPRLHAITDGGVVSLADFGVRAAAIAAAGSAVALHARHPDATAADLAALAARLVALARPAEANVIVSRRADVAAAVHAQGVQLRPDDLAPGDARRVLPVGWIGRSVHTAAEAIAAQEEGADYVVVGPIFPTPSHPGARGRGVELVREASAAGIPVIAIGGIDPERALEVAAAGAWGVAVLSALWSASDPAQAALAFLAAWTDARE